MSTKASVQVYTKDRCVVKKKARVKKKLNEKKLESNALLQKIIHWVSIEIYFFTINAEHEYDSA